MILVVVAATTTTGMFDDIFLLVALLQKEVAFVWFISLHTASATYRQLPISLHVMDNVEMIAFF